jgi:hypothetical protein
MDTPQRAFRLSDEVMAKIHELAAHQKGLSTAKVVAWAVDELHTRVFPRKKSRKSPPNRLTLSDSVLQ